LRDPLCHQLAAIRKEQEKQKLAEEAERLRKIAEEMEAARKAKDAEEAARAQQLKEMEERKKMEAEQKKADEEAQKQQEAARIKAEKEAAKKPQVGANVQTDPCYSALICFTCRILVLCFDHQFTLPHRLVCWLRFVLSATVNHHHHHHHHHVALSTTHSLAHLLTDRRQVDLEEKKRAAEEAAILEQERRDQELAMRLAMDHAGDGGDTSHVLSDEARAQAATGQAKRKKAKAANYEFGTTKQVTCGCISPLPCACSVFALVCALVWLVWLV
jgi:hypothetical protein